jgi:EpsI family protein
MGSFVLRSGAVEPSEDVDLSAIPASIGSWRGREVAVSDRVRARLRSDELFLRAYVEPGRTATPVWALVDYHRKQRLGSTVHSPKVCYPGAGWRIEDITVGEVGETSVRWVELVRERERMLAAYWYETRAGVFARETSLKAAIVTASISRRPADAALVRLSTPIVGDDVYAARDRLRRFIEEGVPALRSALPFDREPG